MARSSQPEAPPGRPPRRTGTALAVIRPVAPPPEARAAHAYRQAATRGPARWLDTVVSPIVRRPAAPAPAPATLQHPAPTPVTHAVQSPTGTAFKLGFGFAAGVLSLRLIVLAVVGTILFVAVARLLRVVTG